VLPYPGDSRENDSEQRNPHAKHLSVVVVVSAAVVRRANRLVRLLQMMMLRSPPEEAREPVP
jgi:hypothetical protein